MSSDDSGARLSLGSGGTHRLRGAPAPWIIEIEEDGTAEVVDAIRLVADAGGYDHRVERAQARRRGGHLQFRFPSHEPGRYTVWIVRSGHERCAWKGLPLPRSAEPPPAAPPDSPTGMPDVDFSC